jgi:hypothetical protein
MFDISADETGWIIALMVAVALLGITAAARWFWR